MKIYLDSNSIPNNYQAYKTKSIPLPDGVTYLGKYSIKLEGKERNSLKRKALIRIIFTLGISYLSSKEVRLNYQGKRIDKLFFNKNVENSLSHSLVPYSLEAALSAIDKASNQGNQIVIYAGRSDWEYVPQESNWLWCTLDKNMQKNELDINRPHFNIDFNQAEEMLALKQRAKKVVVDFSVLKFCVGSPWQRFMELLIIDEDSELIIEAYKNAYIIDPVISDLHSAKYDYFSGEVTIFQRGHGTDSDRAHFKKREEHIPLFLHLLKPKFEKLFKKVELIEDKPYPYHAENEQRYHCDYWHFKGPLWAKEENLHKKLVQTLGYFPEMID